MRVDVARAAVIAGDGVVARYPGIVCVARGPDREAVGRLLDVCAAAAGTDPGRDLARGLARWMGGPDAPGDDLAFGTVARAGDQIGVFLVGATSVSVGGSPDTLSGADAATWTDRLIPRPATPVVLALDGAVPPADLDAGPNDLRAGVVPGAGAVLFAAPDDAADREDGAGGRSIDYAWFADRPGAGDAGRVAPERDTPSANGTTDRTSQLTPDVGPTRSTNGHADPPTSLWGESGRPGGRHSVTELASAGPDPEARADRPLDGVPEQAPPPGAEAMSAPAAVGVTERSSEPEPATERVSPSVEPGSSAGLPSSTAPLDSTMFTATGPPPPPTDAVPDAASLPRRRDRLPAGPDDGVALPAAARLPLGRIVFDDGVTYTVDTPFLVGRMPEADPRARTGELRPMVVDDVTGSVSRVHAEIQIEGWDVVLVDSGSRNGTFVAGPDETAWTALGPGRTSRLVPGTRVRMGGRTFVFEPGTIAAP